MRREDYNRGGLDYENRDYNRDYDREDYGRYEGRKDYDTRSYNRSFDRGDDQNYMQREKGYGRDFDEDRGFGYGRSSGYQGNFGYGYLEGNTGQNWGGRNYSQSGYGGPNYRSVGQPYQSGSFGQNMPIQQHPMGYQYGQQHGQFGQHNQFGQEGFYGHRNDDEIEREVYDRLDNEWQIPDNADIHAQVKEGVVTLTGQVRNRNAKMAAWNCAWQIPGVEDVHNNINIQSRRRQNMNSTGYGQSSMSTGQSSQSGSKTNPQDPLKNK